MQDEVQLLNQSVEDFHILRLGYQDHASLMPLLYPLKAGWIGPESPWKLDVVNDTLPKLLKELIAGTLDAAMVTPLALWQHGQKLAALGGWGLVTEKAAGIGVFMSPQRIDLIDGSDVALTPEAEGTMSEYLLRTILKPYYDVALTLRTSDDLASDPKGPHLLYGDEASMQAQGKPHDWVAEDLGVSWWVLTALPVVWEVLCVRRDLEETKPGATETLNKLLRLSQRTAQEQQSTIHNEAATRLGLNQAKAKELLSRTTYTLGDAQTKAMGRFLDMAGRAGVLRET